MIMLNMFIIQAVKHRDLCGQEVFSLLVLQ